MDITWKDILQLAKNTISFQIGKINNLTPELWTKSLLTLFMDENHFTYSIFLTCIYDTICFISFSKHMLCHAPIKLWHVSLFFILKTLWITPISLPLTIQKIKTSTFQFRRKKFRSPNQKPKSIAPRNYKTLFFSNRISEPGVILGQDFYKQLKSDFLTVEIHE